jgi:hypothetical protein
MNQSTRSRSRTFVTSVVGLALAFVVGMTVPLKAESGGFMCGYGDCWLLYDDCAGAQYTDHGGGLCTIEITWQPGCQISRDCNGGMFGWKGLQDFEWTFQVMLIE